MVMPTVAAISPTVATPASPAALQPGSAGPAGVGGGAPWVDGRLPSPWADRSSRGAPAGSGAGASPVPRSQASATAAGNFTHALAQTRAAMASALPAVQPAHGVVAAAEAGLGKHFGFSSMEQMGLRLSKADVDMSRSIAGLSHLDPTAPDVTAQLLSVSLMSAKASVSETIALKFASKVNESINTLMKTQ